MADSNSSLPVESMIDDFNNVSLVEECWVDALPILKEASNDMYLGQLIHSIDFQLESATHSLEIMNPKLDTRAKGEHFYMPEQLFDKGSIPKDSTLDRKQIIKIIDRLVGLEISWIEGESLPMTLFSCMYLHFPQRLENQIFSTYVNSLLATCDAINQIVSRGDVCCEEDFNLSDFNLTLLYPANQHMVVNIRQLEELIDQLDQQINTEKSKSTKDLDELKILVSLYNRILFRKLFYIIIFSLSVSNLVLAIKSIKEILPVIDFLKNDGYSNRDDIVVPTEIFNGGLVSKLYSSVGAVSQEKTYTAAINSFEKLFTDFQTLFKMPHLLDSTIQRQQLLQLHQQQQQQQQQQNLTTEDNKNNNNTSESTTAPVVTGKNKSKVVKSESIKIGAILDYHIYFSRPSPNIVTRSVLRRLLFPLPLGQFFKSDIMEESLIEWMHEFGIPMDRLVNREKEGVPMFLDTLSKVIQKLFVHMALNRARQRRKLKVSLFELSLLQNEADILDTNIAKEPTNVSIYFGSFIFNLKLRVMQHYLFLGFELDIYSYHEFPSVYYYLDYFYNIQSNVSNYVHKLNYLEKNKNDPPQQQSSSNKKNKNKNKNTKSNNNIQQQQKPPQIPPAPPTIERTLLVAYHTAVRAMFRFLVVLKQNGKIIDPVCDFGTDDLRFMKKFEPFFNPPYQQPEPLTHEICKNSTKTTEPWISLVITTLDILKQSKSAIDVLLLPESKFNVPIPFYQVEEAKQLQRSILSMRLQIQKLLPSFDLSKLTIEKVLALPIPKFSIQIETKPYFPNINIKLD
ncbi:hypothetical protein ACTFIU_010690 [Dictyostelium citrinum]